MADETSSTIEMGPVVDRPPSSTESVDGRTPSSMESATIAGTIPQTVVWDGDGDPENPRNWPVSRKWVNVVLISMQASLSPIASTFLAIGAEAVVTEFGHSDPYTPALPTGLYVLGLSLGPLILGPCSELYGRRIVYLTGFSFFTFFNLGCALAPNIVVLSFFRLLSGIAGAAGPGLGASSIGDMFCVEERGRAQSVYSLGPVMGPVLGGVIGGFVVFYTTGWRWLMWITTIASGLTSIVSIIYMRETYAPYLLKRKAAHLSKQNPQKTFRTEGRVAPARVLFKRAITRPLRLLFGSPICAAMSVYLAVIYGILYLHLITITLLFGPDELYGLFSYRWGGGRTGLAYLGAGTGSLIGMLFTAKCMNRSFARARALQARRTGSDDPHPELRLPFIKLGMAVVPCGLVIYAWSAGRAHWAVPLLGAGVFGLGMLMCYVCIHTYLVDCFDRWAASALAAAMVTRCVVTSMLTIMGFEFYRKLGYAWGSMTLAFLCLVMIPIPFLLQKYGAVLRQKQFED
ncbi:major facilitator superfamily domain-containing protein [Xylariaceae sp. FL0016]|nr:major facilitator superfamily domain-containing protein [Xylariaceae sp. FL0016]